MAHKEFDVIDVPFEPSTLETIDYSVYDYVNEVLNISANTSDNWKKVPIKWVSSERVKHSEKDPEERQVSSTNSAKTIIYPIITIERGQKIKNQASKGKYYANIPGFNDYRGGSINISRRINQEKTANFQNADSRRKIGGDRNVGTGQLNFRTNKKNNKTVIETLTIPQPVYIEIPYKITLWSEYQQHMNEMLQPFISKPGSVRAAVMKRDGHKYWAYFNENFDTQNNIDSMDLEPREYKTVITLKVYGYLIGSGDNDERPSVIKRENVVEFRVPRERTIFGDINEYIKKGKYRP